MKDFVPLNLGFGHISRQDIMQHHTTILAREIFAQGSFDTVLALMDGTYIYIQKSSNYFFQRATYSVDKHRHRPLVKPVMITA